MNEVKNACPVCGRERARDSSRHLLATCGSPSCVAARQGRQVGQIRGAGPHNREYPEGHHACADLEDGQHFLCCRASNPGPDGVPSDVPNCGEGACGHSGGYNCWSRSGLPVEMFEGKACGECGEQARVCTDVGYRCSAHDRPWERRRAPEPKTCARCGEPASIWKPSERSIREQVLEGEDLCRSCAGVRPVKPLRESVPA